MYLKDKYEAFHNESDSNHGALITVAKSPVCCNVSKCVDKKETDSPWSDSTHSVANFVIIK